MAHGIRSAAFRLGFVDLGLVANNLYFWLRENTHSDAANGRRVVEGHLEYYDLLEELQVHLGEALTGAAGRNQFSNDAA